MSKLPPPPSQQPDDKDGNLATEDPMDLEDAESLVNKTLVLIDFNGMLVLKDKKGQVKVSSLRYFVGGTGKGRVKFYLRPGVEQLIARLASDSRCKFAIYTSMMRHNIAPFFQLFDESQLPAFEPIECDGSSVCTSASLARSMWRLFDQPFNTNDPQPEDPYAFKRDLTKIWRDQTVAKSGFTSQNTLLVEGEAIKSRDWAANTLQPQEFTVEDAVRRDRDGDATLSRLGDDLDYIFTEMQKPGATIPAILAQMRSRGRAAPRPTLVPPHPATDHPPADASLREADRIKALGNDAFAAKKYEESIIHYTMAIQLDKRNHVLYSNRSAAYASIGNYGMALSDAKMCLQLQPKWEKGQLRMGFALQGLGRLDEAIAAYRLAGPSTQASSLIASAEQSLKLKAVFTDEGAARSNIEVQEAKLRDGLLQMVALNNIMAFFRGKRDIPEVLWTFAGFPGPVPKREVERFIANRKDIDDVHGKWKGPDKPYRAPLFEGPPATPQPRQAKTLHPLEVRLVGRKKTWITGAMQCGIPIAEIRRVFPRCVVKAQTVEVAGDEVMTAVDVLSKTAPLETIDVVNSDNPQLVMTASSLFARNEDGELVLREDVELDSSSDEEGRIVGNCGGRRRKTRCRRVKMLGFYVFRTRKY